MNTAALPRLRDEVIVRPFDDGGTRPRYVIAVDGRHFIVTPAVAAILDETRKLEMSEGAFETLAQRVSHRLGTSITSQQVKTLICERIPKMLFEPAKGVNTEQSPLIARRLLLSGARLKPAFALAAPLFTPRAAAIACALAVLMNVLLALQVWKHGVEAAGAADYLASFVLTLAGILVHELGHLTACHRFGGQHGGIGIGIYWCLPAFYAEVHGAWVLPRCQRAAVDAGGVYLQFLFTGLLGVLYLFFAFPALPSAIALTHLLMLHTLNPVLKFDGYWLLCDLAGIHNLHHRVRDIARRLLHGDKVPRSEAGLFTLFLSIAFAYFAYLLAVLGQSLGLAMGSFLVAAASMNLSLASLLGTLGKGMLLAFMLAIALGVALALARVGGAILREE